MAAGESSAVLAALRALLGWVWDLLGPVRRRLAFEHTHDWPTRAVVLGFAAAWAVGSGWLLADLRLRTPAFVVAALGGAYLLYDRPTRRDVVIRGLYGLAMLVLATPVVLSASLFVLPHGTGAVTNPWALSLTVGDLVVLVAFALLAAVPGGAAFVLEYRR
ncbi:hypothetical protein BRD00_11035 [Halobacteriales archaeon QS_8_69_26]|nr:MAG: hypothetical protein BRD00_11035 [Halobacteriales archaeon QS_8_69_26]